LFENNLGLLMFFCFVGILGESGVRAVNGGYVWCAMVWQSFFD
jgi:hypothetical protein